MVTYNHNKIAKIVILSQIFGNMERGRRADPVAYVYCGNNPIRSYMQRQCLRGNSRVDDLTIRRVKLTS